MAILLSIHGHNIGLKYELKGKTTIGRADENDIWIPHPNVSRYHCVIEKRGSQYYIIDNNSKNGVIVNGKKVAEALLQPQDKIQIGNTTFVFEPPFDLTNVLFDNKVVCLLPPTAETIRIFGDEELSTKQEAQPSPALEFIEQLAGLFSPESVSLSHTLKKIVQQIAQMFNAECCVLFLHDPISQQLQPIAGSGKSEYVPVGKDVVRRAFEEKKTVYVSSIQLPESVVLLEESAQSEFTVVCTPVVLTLQHTTILKNKVASRTAGDEEQAIGVLCIARSINHPFSVNEVMHFRALGKIIALPVEIARNYDRLMRRTIAAQKTATGEVNNLARIAPARIVYIHPAMKEVIQMAEQVAEHSTTVLICGETGTGKELIARYIHWLSPRREAPFMAINCAAIPETLFESELFGHERGAFTGAERLKQGKVEVAHGGTLFLDEISELSLDVQPKLLRFLEEKIFYRIGGTRPIQVDVRIIAATNKDLEELVRQNTFRQDLFYRLSVVKINIPPLRERPADVKPLAEYFIQHYAKELGKEILGISDEALILLEKYPWPGNVRELQNCIERAVLVCDTGIIEPRHIFLEPVSIKKSQAPPRESEKSEIAQEFIPYSLAEIEKEHIRRVLEYCNWNQVKAAELLGIHRNTLRQKINEYKLTPPK